MSWLTLIANMLSLYDMDIVWENQTSLNLSYAAFKQMCKLKLEAYYNKQWFESVQTSSVYFINTI